MPTTARWSEHTIRHLTLAATLPVLLTACGSGSDAVGKWSGTVDTLPSGQIVVRNTDDPLWAPEEAWRVVEDLRIGEAMSEGPALFGGIYSFDVDAWGRIFVLDNQAQEVRIFDSEGAFVRTVGRRGEGPGEFTQAGSVDLALNGQIWVMGMGEGRVSIFDTTGTYLRGERTNAGGMILRPYRGGFDPMGRYNVVIRSAGMRGMARFDQSYNPIDTISLPENPEEGESFRLVGDDGRTRMSAAVPFQGFNDEGRLFDPFDAEGRYLGMLRLPFSLRRSIPEPIVRNGVLYGVTSDEIGVLYVVRARIVRPSG